MSVGEVFTFTKLLLESERREIPLEATKQALETAVMSGIYTVIGITDLGDFIYQKVPREDRIPIIEL